MINNKVNYIILILLIFSVSAKGQQDGTVKYQGFFPDDTKNKVLISLKQVKSKLTGILKHDNSFETSKLEGYINKEKVFRLFELDTEGNRTGVSMKGTIDGGKMAASFSDRGNVFKFDFVEVDTNNPDGTLKVVKRVNEQFAELELYFKTLGDKNINIKYNDLAYAIKVGNSPFLDYSITKVGSYAASFTIRERMRYIQKHSYGKKVKFEDGCTGLIVHAYYFSSYEGALFNTYMFVYDEYGEYVQSFVVYEAMKLGEPNISTKFSMSQIFSLTDYSQGNDEAIKFRIDKNGEIDILDRD